MRLMIVGAEGSLGEKLRSIVEKETSWSVSRITRRAAYKEGTIHPFDSSNRPEWHTLLEQEEWRPDVIVNVAAMTQVDACETRRTEAWASNVTLVETLVTECRRYGLRLVHLSSDYIFDGQDGPYQESAAPNPINYYGKTKLAAENACIKQGIDCAIIRTMWLYGEVSGGRPSFVQWLVDALTVDDRVRVVTDEIGNPTLLDDVAYGIIKVIEKNFRGVMNIAGPELMSRWEFALAVANVFGLDISPLIPVTSADLQRPARRPLNSGLISLKAQTSLGLRLTPVSNGLEITRILEQRMAREL